MGKRSTNFNSRRRRTTTSDLLNLMDALGISADEQRRIATSAIAPRCELCGDPAERVGEQWVCRACSPVLDDEPARTNDAEDRYNRGGW